MRDRVFEKRALADDDEEVYVVCDVLTAMTKATAAATSIALIDETSHAGKHRNTSLMDN